MEFRSDDDHFRVVRLALGEPADSGVHEFGSFNIEVEIDELRWRHSAITRGGDGVDGYLRELAEEWKGWEGIRRWDSLEHGLSIRAAHLGNAVQLAFVLRGGPYADAWKLRVPIIVEPGESLSRLAKEAAVLVGRV